MIVATFGDFHFENGEKDGAVTIQTLTFSRASRLQSHATVEGEPVVDFLGTESPTLTIKGILHSAFCGDVNRRMNDLLALQKGKPRAFVQGAHSYGLFVVRDITFDVATWTGNAPAAISWTMNLVGARMV